MGMSARYNLASKMAEILTNLDYPSQDLGYQTFLYSSENELRKLFEFLIDKLPKEQNADIGEDQDELDVKKVRHKEISEALSPSKPLKTENEIFETESFSSWDVEEMKDEELFKLLPKETRAAAIDARIKMNALVQQNEELKQQNVETVSDLPSETRSSEAEVVTDGIQNERVLLSSNLEKDMVNESKENERKIQDERKTQELKRKEQDAEEKAKLEALKNRKETLQKEIEALQNDYKKSVKTLKKNKVEIITQNEKFKTLQIEKEEKEKSLEKRKKIMELMPSGEENLQKLREIIAKK